MRATMQQVRSSLNAYEATLREIVEAAWATWLTIPPHIMVQLDRRARACCVWCFMVAAAKERFEGKQDVVVMERGNTAFFIVGDRVVVRFKKLDSDGASSNLITPLQFDFREQLDFPGIPSDLPRVDVGYVLNELGTGVEAIKVSHPTGDRGVAWCYEIVAGPTAEIIPFEIDADMPAARVRRRDEAVPMESLNTGTNPDQG